MRRDSVEQYQMGGCNAPLLGFDRLGTFSWWPFSPKISSAPVTWVFLCSLGGTMSRVFVRIHWCWGYVAVPMAPGTGHGPLLVWKIVACLSLLFDFDPFAVVPHGGHFGRFYSNDTV